MKGDSEGLIDHTKRRKERWQRADAGLY